MNQTAMPPLTPVLLLILDGFGYREDGADNAILHAHTPHWDQLWATCPHTTLQASEAHVGLPRGQFGNSETGHLNIGAGRIVHQDLTRVDLDIEAGRFGQNPVLQTALRTARDSGQALHILGLLSDGGVHSHQDQMHALLREAVAGGVSRIHVHAFLDGRDTPPRSAELYLQRLEDALAAAGGGQIASISGRYYGMDRDKRWERVQPAYELIVAGQAPFHAPNAQAGLAAAYARGENDEFVQATAIHAPDQAPVAFEDGDVLVFMNFRADRARQLCHALTDPAFSGFPRSRMPKPGYFCTLTQYAADLPLPAAYLPQTVPNTLGEYLSSLGLRQLRIAETEKYPHVTFFLSGGVEAPYPGEERLLVPSPKVATYDLQPEMSAPEVTRQLVAAIGSRRFDAIICNYANCDMVGHTGKLPAAIQAVETLDRCVAEVVAAMRAHGGEVLITADHGNCEQMFDHMADQQHTQHTTNPVPFVYVGRPATCRTGGSLQDIAPTLLTLMGLPIPPEMTGQSLLTLKDPIVG